MRKVSPTSLPAASQTPNASQDSTLSKPPVVTMKCQHVSVLLNEEVDMAKMKSPPSTKTPAARDGTAAMQFVPRGAVGVSNGPVTRGGARKQPVRAKPAIPANRWGPAE